MPTLTGCSVCFKRALAIAKSFSRGSASIEIAAEFFWVSVMVVFMVACGLQKYTPCCKGLRLRIWVHTIYYQPGRLQEFRRCRMESGRTSDLFSSMKSKLECPSQAPEVEGGTGADHGSAKHKRGNSFAPAVLLPTGSWEKASTGVASSTFAPNQNLQTS